MKKLLINLIPYWCKRHLLIVLIGLQSCALMAAVPIKNCSDLQGMQYDLAGDYELATDINCIGTDFFPIGSIGGPFIGSFWGKNHVIFNLNINRKYMDYVGIFGATNKNARIHDVILTNVTISGKDHVGSLIGMAHSTSISGIKIQGTISGKNFVGGVIGEATDKTLISNSGANGEVSGSNTIGGLVGKTNVNIISSYAHTNIRGQLEVGGLVGSTDDSIKNSYATGNVIGTGIVGGLAGKAHSIENSYATGSVTTSNTSASMVGGLAGYADRISKSYATGDITAIASSNSTIKHPSNIGGLVGFAVDIIDSYAAGNVYAVVKKGNTNSEGGDNVGGLVGSIYCAGNASLGIISNSYALGEVWGKSHVGGLVGSISGHINKSFSKGKVYGSAMIGGLVGSDRHNYYDPPTNISDSYATGSVFGTIQAGGLIGYSEGAVLNNCYSTGKVSGDSPIGGLIGEGEFPYVMNSYWDIQTSQQPYSSGGEGKLTRDMFHQNSYQGWDFITIWLIQEGQNYPTLRTTTYQP